ncbi:hypothetical protein RF11_05894 [Thelohanellus kitauei]|uniref:Uncharacterized protein n=2 Tax=Thelohanellus kitauei TaxID=669202 RepID=A0A0C2NL67_THEKT|nr:hypothetical protein RF11_05894 [Thelohanellus kitauei]
MCLAPYQGGYFIGIIERFGRYNGYAFSIINIFGSLSGVLQRVVVIVLAVIFPDPRVSIRWSFGITSFISFILSLPYVFLGDCSRAPWVDGQPAKAPLVVADNKSPDEHKRESMESAA